METRANYVLIGAFTLIIASALLLFGLWAAKYSSERTWQEYRVVFREAVTGLSVGSPVQYNGIAVGSITELNLVPDDPRQVVARIRLNSTTPVKTDTRAKLAITSLTGPSIIQLSGGTPQSPPLEGKDGRLPVIVASPSPIARLLNDSSDLVTNINLLLHNANQMFSDDNIGHLSSTLANLDKTTSAFAGQNGGIAQAIEQLVQVGKQASATLAETQALMRNANGLLNNNGKQMFGSAEQAMKSLEQSTATINTLLTNNQEALGNGMQGLNSLAPAIRELRDTLGSLRAISRRLESNPSGYLLGHETDKEFTP